MNEEKIKHHLKFINSIASIVNEATGKIDKLFENEYKDLHKEIKKK